LRQIGSSNGEIDIAPANGVHPMPAFANRARNRGKGHVLRELQHQGLEQQGESPELTDPVRFHLRIAIRQLELRYPYFKHASMLKEIEVPQPLDLGVVNVVFAWRPRMTKLGATHEIDTDGHLVPLGIEIHLLDEPRLGDTQSLCKQFIDLVSHFASAPVRQSVPLRAGRAVASTREPSQPSAAIEQQAINYCNVIPERRRRRRTHHGLISRVRMLV